MWHNVEYRKFTYVFFILLILFTIVMSVCVSMIGAIILFVCGLCLYLSCAVFTTLRYRSIAALSNYLQAVYNGQETMDIRNHKEGELSVLKSEIYKITSILKQQSDTMHKEKIFLADSLSNISHQLKTPLTGMLVMSELLQDEALPQEKRKEFLAQIQTQLKRIEWLVTTLLKISKIDAQAIEFHKQPIPLTTIINKALEPIRIPLEIKEINCHVECDEHILIHADENWCIEAFVNIFKNCMEHTPVKGTLQICCEDNPLQSIVCIKDSGCGIDPEDIPHIFERFYKGKNAASESAGIGLSLSKKILLEHAATIQVESELQKGSTFTICFHK
ncbi:MULTISPECIES: sensor histidine kinase [Bacillota]|jgi:signal transduction histidine kinase|uniref:histidine kinase n=2 Tax=Amedibacillus TaxID=2749846 RepID=A0A7G9GLE1_9FIRM|nr:MULTISPECIES: HAMP domain-containing sensor histidine kinase [Bacillota]QNM11623.1 HAMP domain-containing histidine kinase [[Eubacterium] hominis]MCH4285131.1 HAMP domain-containing histidine kinase [Amedibacillus hominis]RGB56159.1 sensor histidine kinase [Absiella sp. AM22-9]RGB61920.1 sensor histidine kinase [Absiella sp. AM10-20]RGB70258.1 sensor histidine kinase [Absiella sp. AM09-45]